MTGDPRLKLAAPNSAQPLVTRGYRGQSRRNYLIQLVDDDAQEQQACSYQAPLGARGAFYGNRRSNWVDHGILPIKAFRQVVDQWICKRSADLKFSVDVGITFEGFLQLGAHPQLTDLFRRKAPAYAEGAYWRAAKHLGDSGPSAPQFWNERYRNSNIHAVLVFHAAAGDYARDVMDFETSVLSFTDSASTPGSCVMEKPWIECGQPLENPNEIHFGMVDGLSAPRFYGIHAKKQLLAEKAINRHMPGELLLGHEKNDGSNPWLVPGANVQASMPKPISPVSAQKVYGAFFRDGTFGVLRRMYQHVPKLEAYLQSQAAPLHGSENTDYFAAWLKAKMLGRWPNGERVSEKIDPSTEDENDLTDAQKRRMTADTSPTGAVGMNDFEYLDDRKGLQCPFGAHIRRMNPRDDPVVPRLRRPLLRRGLPYGEKYDPGKNNTSDDRGMLGLFFCASLEEQFEHLLGNWANRNPMGMPFAQDGKDPLIGNHEPNSSQRMGNQFEIPMSDAPPIVLKGLDAFVETRGTCYAFFPSVPALTTIASGAIATASRFLQRS